MGDQLEHGLYKEPSFQQGKVLGHELELWRIPLYGLGHASQLHKVEEHPPASQK